MTTRRSDSQDAKADLGSLVEAASSEGACAATEDSSPSKTFVPRRTGFLEGLISDIPDDFDRLAEDEIAQLFGVTD